MRCTMAYRARAQRSCLDIFRWSCRIWPVVLYLVRCYTNANCSLTLTSSRTAEPQLQFSTTTGDCRYLEPYLQKHVLSRFTKHFLVYLHNTLLQACMYCSQPCRSWEFSSASTGLLPSPERRRMFLHNCCIELRVHWQQ